MMNKAITAGLLLSLGFAAVAAEPPTASISNGVVRAKLNLPDVDNGYYRGARFDWSGSVASLETNGHTYFGQWFARYDPKVHDSITGPVEDYAPLNYTESKPGETFVKIGIGVLKRLDEQPYRFSAQYELLDTGKWSVRTRPDFVEYRHELAAAVDTLWQLKRKSEGEATLDIVGRETEERTLAMRFDREPTRPSTFPLSLPFPGRPNFSANR
jgi:hypothetical protein